MYKKIFSFLVLVGALAFADQKTSAPFERQGEVWGSDYATALKLSQATGKPLLLAFMGSDWCPWSAKMQAEIISKTEFMGALRDQVIFVCIDFPQEVEANSQNMELKNRYSVQELPTLVLVDASGDEIVKLGYLPVSPQEVVVHLNKALNDYRHLKSVVRSPRLSDIKGEELEQLYCTASELGREEERQSLLEAGLKSDKSAFFLMRQYEEAIEKKKLKELSVQKLRKQIMATDPVNNKGMHLELAVAEFHALSKRLKQKENPGKAIGPLVEYLRTYGSKDLENSWRVEMMIAQFLFSKNKLEEAVVHVKNSYELAPNEYKSEVAQSVDYLTKQLGNTNPRK